MLLSAKSELNLARRSLELVDQLDRCSSQWRRFFGIARCRAAVQPFCLYELRWIIPLAADPWIQRRSACVTTLRSARKRLPEPNPTRGNYRFGRGEGERQRSPEDCSRGERRGSHTHLEAGAKRGEGERETSRPASPASQINYHIHLTASLDMSFIPT
jgi:hypothetical protein